MKGQYLSAVVQYLMSGKTNLEDQGVYGCCLLTQAQSQWSNLIGILKSVEPSSSSEVCASRCAQHSKPCLIGVLGFVKKAIKCTAAVWYGNPHYWPEADSWDEHSTETSPFWKGKYNSLTREQEKIVKMVNLQDKLWIVFPLGALLKLTTCAGSKKKQFSHHGFVNGKWFCIYMALF